MVLSTIEHLFLTLVPFLYLVVIWIYYCKGWAFVCRPSDLIRLLVGFRPLHAFEALVIQELFSQCLCIFMILKNNDLTIASVHYQ